MTIIRTAGITVAVIGAGLALAGPASADDRLDGSFTYVNGPTTNTWSITTFCNEEITCGGSVSGSTGMLARINRTAGGPWTVVRHDVPNGRVCVDGSTGPADLVYAFDPASLAGTLSTTSKPGACGDPNPLNTQQPISLIPV